MNFNLDYMGFEENLIDRHELDHMSANIQYIFKFDNDYGASVVKSKYSYGGRNDEWELAVLLFDKYGEYHITYETPITDDVLGYLTDDEVRDNLALIKNLKS